MIFITIGFFERGIFRFGLNRKEQEESQKGAQEARFFLSYQKGTFINWILIFLF